MSTHTLAYTLLCSHEPTRMLQIKAAYMKGSRRGNQEQTAMNTAHRAIAHTSLRGMTLNPFPVSTAPPYWKRVLFFLSNTQSKKNLTPRRTTLPGRSTMMYSQTYSIINPLATLPE